MIMNTIRHCEQSEAIHASLRHPERSRIIWAVRSSIRVIPDLIGNLQGVSLSKACFSVDNLLYYICHTHRASMRQRIAYFGEFFCL